MDLYGNPNLQGGQPALQGSTPMLQPAGNPQQTATIYGPPSPGPSPAPVKPVAPVKAVAPISAPAVQVAQPDNQINSIFSSFIGSRPSPSNPGVLEYYNKQTGQGFSSPQQLYAYASTLGAGAINSFDQLHAPVNQAQPTYNQQVQNYQPVATPQQSVAQNAGTAGLSVDDYLKLLQSQNQITPDQLKTIQDNLGIPAAAEAAYAPPSQSTVDFFNQAYTQSGLSDLTTKIQAINEQINKRQQDFIDAQGVINENPFLSEASRVGRISRLNDKAQEEIGNLTQQQAQLQQLYQNGFNEVTNLVTAHTTDFTQNQQQNQAHLQYLLGLATTQSQAIIAQNNQNALKYLPAYLQAKAKATPGTTVSAPSGATFYWDKNSGTFQQLTPAAVNADVNSVTGDLYSKNTGQVLGGNGGGGFPSGAATPGSAAAVNNVAGMKGSDGKFIPYSNPQDSFNAVVSDIQAKQSGNTRTGLNGNSTLTQFVNTWVNGNPNSPAQGYNANNVAQYLSQLGVQVTPNTPIGQINSAQLATAISHFETGYSPGGNNTDVINNLAQELVDGQIAPSQVKGRAQADLIFARADQLSKSQNGIPFDQQAAEINYQNSGDIRPILNNESSANAHLDTVLQDAKELRLTGNRIANVAILDSKLALGDSSAKKYVQAVQDAQSEIAKVLAGNGQITDDVRKQAQGFLDIYVGPDTLQSLVDQARTLMHQKVVAYTAKRDTSGNSQNSNNSNDPLGLGI